MGIDITANPRIVQLLAKVEASRRDVAAGGAPPPTGAEPDLDSAYVDVGKYVHWLLRQDPAGLARVAEEARQYADAMDEALGVVPLDDELDEAVNFDELGIDDLGELSITDLPQFELSADTRAGGVDVRDMIEHDEITDVSDEMFEPLDDPEDLLPEPLPYVEPDEEETGAYPSLPDLDARDITDAVPLELDEDDVTDLSEAPLDDDVFNPVPELPDEAFVGGGIAVRTGGFAAVTIEEVPPLAAESGKGVAPDEDWLGRLRSLLQDFGGPQADLDDAAVEAAAVHAVERITTNVEVHWMLFPQAVQQALLGLVGARCRLLESRGVGGAEVQLALGRLSRYAADRSLLVVPSLRAKPPSSRNWGADERRYWAVLHAGL